MNRKIESPVRRLTKSYANQKMDGVNMVDLIDATTGYTIAYCIYEPYADEILDALSHIKTGERK